MGLTELTALPRYSPLAIHELLAAQVRSYHRHYRMGENSSVPVEVAGELLSSIRYTLTLAGEGGSIYTALQRGQQYLQGRLEAARQLHTLVSGTGDDRSQWRWEALALLKRYLDGYDVQHFAHRIPENLFYPLGIPVPEGMQGIGYAQLYLQCLWLENQILEAFPPRVLELLDRQLPPDYWEAPENLCEQPLWNALGRVLAGKDLGELTLSEADRLRICRTYSREAFDRGCDRVCRALELPGDCRTYALSILAALRPRLEVALAHGDLSRLLL